MHSRSKGALMMGMLAMAAMMDSPHGSGFNQIVIDPERAKRDRERAERDYRRNLLKKGVQEFVIDGKTILARNYKNALRKSKLK